MNFLKEGKTNWKFLLIVIILAIIVGGGILSYLGYFKREMISLTKFPEIKKPEILKEEICFLKAKLEENIYSESEKKWTKIDPTSQEIQGESLKEAIIQQTVQYMMEISKPLPSLKERFCKAGIARITLGTKKIDVNEDGISEYIVDPQYVYFDKPVEWDVGTIDDFMLVGANWEHFYIFGLKEGKWSVIGDLGEGLDIKLLKKQTEGYHNLVTWPHISSWDMLTLPEFVWNGEKYELVKRTTFTVCEGFERSKEVPEEYLELIREDFCSP